MPNHTRTLSLRGQLLTGFLLALSGGLSLLPTALSAQENLQTTSAPYVTHETVKEWVDQGLAVTFLDVRQSKEFHAGHLPGAINVVFDQVAAMRDELPTDRPIVTYCIHSAHRAPEAAKTLRQLGFDNAYVLEGGIVAWQAGGLTIRATDLAQDPTILPQPECVCSGPVTP